MISYTYKCKTCGARYEVRQSIKKPLEELTPCPECDRLGELVVEGGVGIRFNGTGFHCNDYNKSGPVR